MKAKKFKEQNVVYAKNQPEYLQLPALKLKQGEVISCWELTLKERLKLIFTGKIWACVLTFNKPLQPMCLTINKKEFINS